MPRAHPEGVLRGHWRGWHTSSYVGPVLFGRMLKGTPRNVGAAGGGKKDSPRGSFVALRDEAPSPLFHGEVIGGAKPEPPIPKNWRYFGVRLLGTGGT